MGRISLSAWWRAILLLIAVPAIALGAVTALAQTDHVDVPPTNSPLPGSAFQGGDGNQDNDVAAGLIDWQGLQANGVAGHTSDPQSGDNIFQGGDKELEPGGWGLTTAGSPSGATPGSANILDAYRSVERPNGRGPFLYLAFTRFSANGTIYVTFELNQDRECRIQGEPCGTWRNPNGAVVACRTTGDLLISFTEEGDTARVQVARWITTHKDPDGTGCATEGVLEPATNMRPSPAGDANIQAGFNYCAGNPCRATDEIATYLPGYFARPQFDFRIPGKQFGEAAVNLESVLAGLDDECAVFGSTWMHSRSSVSVTSDMKDLITPEPFRLRTCRAEPKLSSSTRRHRRLSESPAIHDRARLRDGDDPTGTLTFRLYGPGDRKCTREPVFTDTATVLGNGSYRSGSYSPTRRGRYRWVVEYSGDVDNEPAGPTRCGKRRETVRVRKARPKLSSVAQAADVLSDAAHLERGFRPTGTITFRLYGPGDDTCSGDPVATSTASVSGNGVYNSAPHTPAHAGTYRWVVFYSGDRHNKAAGPTACGIASETVVVARAEPELVTSASSAVQLGDPISDTAVLSGGTDPTGTIEFRLYGPDDEDCSGTPVHTATVAVHGNGSYDSGGFTPERPGTYRWVARYSGDRDNEPASTSCGDEGESVEVAQPPLAQPILSTTASPGAPAGAPIHDTAHLSGGANPTGTITFTVYGPDDATCAGPPADVLTVTVTGPGDHDSGPFTPTEAGTYRWTAEYSGDEHNLGAGPTDCADPAETVTVAPAQPQIRTMAQQSAPVGGAIRDGAFLSGASEPTGTITFRLYGPDDPACSGPPVFQAEQEVVGRNGFYPSPRFRTLQAGTYLWTATYGGDENNAPVATTCGESGETSTVLPRRPRLSTSASPRAYLRHGHGRRVRAAGEEIYDSAKLRLTFRGTGEITFYLYGPGDPGCAGPPIFKTATDVDGNGIYNSRRFTPTASGTYRWRAIYSGDANNKPAGPTDCDDPAEQVHVSVPAHPALTTSASQAVTLGGAVHDVAHLSGGADPTGTITFRLYGASDAGCSRAPVFRATVAVAGNGDYASPSFVPGSAGAYRWVAGYSGDASNRPAGPTRCGDPAERVIVRSPAVTPVVPAFSTAVGQQTAGGATLFDTAFLSGGIDPGGAITFELFGPDDTTCSRPPAFVTTVAVAGNGAYRSATFPVPGAGTYRWVASYSGDALNAGAGPTACGESSETITLGSGVAGESSTGPNVPTPRQKPRPRPKPPAHAPAPIVTG